VRKAVRALNGVRAPPRADEQARGGGASGASDASGASSATAAASGASGTIGGGFLYYAAEPYLSRFPPAFLRALGLPAAIDSLESRIVLSVVVVIWSVISSFWTMNSVSQWDFAEAYVYEAAAKYKARHGRRAVLVLDAAERIAEEDPALLKRFARLGKKAPAAAEGGASGRGAKDGGDGDPPLFVVFVASSSGGATLPRFDSEYKSSLSLCKRALEVGDVADEEAVA
jgi:hypothetical protein